MSKSSDSLFGHTRLILLGLVVLLLGLGLAIRLYDLSDLPLDFHPTRQLLSHLKARGMYYQGQPDVPEWQRKMAIQQWRTRAEVEPEVFERLVAFTYRFTGVDTSVARVYASVFWIAGGVFLFLLARQLGKSEAALISLTYYLFHPYGIVASRSFQPDVLMVMLILMFWWAFWVWTRLETWKWVVIAGIAGGLAIYVKFVAAFFVIGAAVGLGLAIFGVRLFRNRQVWLMTTLGTIPAGLYLYDGIVREGFLGRQFSGRFVPELLLSPLNYLQWAGMANLAAGGLAIAIGLLGLLMVRSRALRWMFAGLWSAYVLFGLFFDYHVATHDYYHLPLIALVAVSIVPVAATLAADFVPNAPRPWGRLALVAILLYAAFGGAWDARTQLSAVNYRPQAGMWAEIGDRLEHGPNVVALTQDYGSRLAYWGWQNTVVWPYVGDFEYRQVRGGSLEFEEAFAKLTEGNTFFLVTDFAELGRQPELMDRLQTYDVIAQGDGYVIYNLESRGGS
jgi:4-amino-4-deoxy-L-arabinose transferase-like glycosyltransferase